MTILSCWKSLGSRIMKTLWSNSRERTQGNEKRQTQRTSTIPWLYLKTMMSVNLYESWKSKIDIFGDKTNRTVLTLPYSCDNSWVSFRNYRGRSSEKLKAREDEIEEVKKQKTLKNRDEDWNSAKWKQIWTLTIVSSSSSSAWREWSSDQTREYSDWQSPADWKSSDQARECSDWQSADLDSSDQAREATTWQLHCTWQWGHLHRSSQGYPWRRK